MDKVNTGITRTYDPQDAAARAFIGVPPEGQREIRTPVRQPDTVIITATAGGSLNTGDPNQEQAEDRSRRDANGELILGGLDYTG